MQRASRPEWGKLGLIGFSDEPLDMKAKQCIMHIYRINSEEIAQCPPAFNNTQCLTPDEIIDILLFGAPKSWQREMDRQGFVPLAKTVTEVVEFVERIEMSEDFDGNNKVAAVTKKGNNINKKKSYNKGNLDADGSKCCMLHGNNNTHDALEHEHKVQNSALQCPPMERPISALALLRGHP